MKRFSFLWLVPLLYWGHDWKFIIFERERKSKVSENDSPLLHLSETLPIMSPTTKMTAPALKPEAFF